MKRIAVLLSLVFIFGVNESKAQILKGLGKKIEKKIEDRIDRKADKNVDKVLDKAENEADKPFDNLLNKPANKATPAAPIQKTEVQSPSANNTVSLSEGLVVMSGASCTDFIWFKSGAMMEFETKDAKGGILNKSRMEIAKVRNEGAVTVADAISSDNEGNSFEMQFKCAGDRMYMDFGSLIKQALQKAGQEGADNANIQRALDNTEIGFSDGFMDFPKSMYPGQVLGDVSVSINSSPSPQLSIEMVSTLTDRKVVAKERITTAAGSFDCLKITGTRKSSMKIMGMNRKLPTSTEHMWFAPGIGVIKQEDFDEKGKLSTSMNLTAYKL